MIGLGEKPNKLKGFLFFSFFFFFFSLCLEGKEIMLKLKDFLFVYVPVMKHSFSLKYFMGFLSSLPRF